MSNPLSAKEAIKQSPELQELIDEIKSWMMDNDYECGEHGSRIYEQLSKLRND